MYDRAFARRVNDHVHGVTNLPMPTGHRVRLMTAMGDEVDYGTEAGSGGGYISNSGAPLLDYAPADLNAVCTLDQGVNVTNWPRTETLVGVEIWADIAGTPTRIELGAFTFPISITAGANLAIGPTALASALESKEPT